MNDLKRNTDSQIYDLTNVKQTTGVDVNDLDADDTDSDDIDSNYKAATPALNRTGLPINSSRYGAIKNEVPKRRASDKED